MDAEIRHHLDCETEELVRLGVPLDEARRQALVAFGGIEPIKEAARDARGTRLAEDVAGDLRYGWRILRRAPGVTVASVLTFALGIGIATTIFSAVYGVLLRPLPYADPGRLVAVWERDVTHGHDRNVVSFDNFDAWTARARGIEGWAALMPVSVTLTDHGAPERVIGADVSPSYFRLLGVAPTLGRDLEAHDALDGRAVMLSDAFWKRRYGSDPSIVGRTMTISGASYEIVGVMPASFDPPRFGWLGGQALWFPMMKSADRRSWGRFLLVLARLRAGVTPEQAGSEMRAIAAQRERETPDDKGWSASVVPLKDELTANTRTMLLVLFGAVALLLIMAVTNVATLTASGMRRRGAELAIRRAIGATDERLFRQLFVQSALLAMLGTVTGLIVAVAGVRILVALLPPETPRLSAIRVDAPVLAIASAVAILATLLFGSAAARRGRASAAGEGLARPAEDTRGTARSGGGVLIAVEIALTLALGVMSVLMARSLAGLRHVDLGFTADEVAVARLALPATALCHG
jgi:putative ABC transport system permease protein